MCAKSFVYFPNLNGLRFVAAAAVIVHHTEQIKWRFGVANIWTTSAPIALIGKLGVVLFFVLSGFLITYLLLEEEERSGRIAVGKFYMRRALRIWPLYYVVVLSALFVLPYCTWFQRPDIGIEVIHQNLPLKSALYITFFANVVLANVGLVPYASHTWSIGTEEQFYLIWPLLMKWVHRTVPLMLAVIAIYLAVGYLLQSGGLGTGRLQSGLRSFLSLQCRLHGHWRACGSRTASEIEGT